MCLRARKETPLPMIWRRLRNRSGEKLGLVERPACGLDERLHLCRILLAGTRFDAAGDIDCRWANGSDCLGHVLCDKSAGENKRRQPRLSKVLSG